MARVLLVRLNGDDDDGDLIAELRRAGHDTATVAPDTAVNTAHAWRPDVIMVIDSDSVTTIQAHRQSRR
jgi:hypothetical protein